MWQSLFVCSPTPVADGNELNAPRSSIFRGALDFMFESIFSTMTAETEDADELLEPPWSSYSIAELQKKAELDLSSAYDALLETFELEKAKHLSALTKLEDAHKIKMAKLTAEVSDLSSQVHAKQRDTDSSLCELEKRLTSLIAARISAAHEQRLRECGEVKLELQQQIHNASSEIKTLHADHEAMTERFETKRLEHAEYLARAAREGLQQAQRVARTQIGAARAQFDKPIQEARSALQAQKILDAETAEHRRREASRLADELAEATRAFNEQLTIEREHASSTHCKSSAESLDEIRIAFDERAKILHRDLKAAEDREGELEDEVSSIRAALDYRTRDEARADADTASLFAGAFARAVDLADIQARDETAAAQLNLKLTVDKAVQAERALRQAEIQALDYAQAEAKQATSREIFSLRSRLERAQAEATNAEQAAERDFRAAQVALQESADKIKEAGTLHPLPMANDNSSPDSSAACGEESKCGDAALEAQLHTLRTDACALRHAVLELRREIAVEESSHAERLELLSAQISRCDTKLQDGPFDSPKRRRRRRREWWFDVATEAAWEAIIAGGRATARETTVDMPARGRGDTLHSPSTKRTVLRAREDDVRRKLALLHDGAGATDDEAVRERRRVLELEAQALDRISSASLRQNDGIHVDGTRTSTQKSKLRKMIFGPRSTSTKLDKKKRVDVLKLRKRNQMEVAREIRAFRKVMVQTASKMQQRLDFDLDAADKLARAFGIFNVAFVDLDFPPTDDAALFGRRDAKPKYDGSVVWRRASDIFKSPSIFSSGINPTDVRHGALGDSWFICALSAVAEFPELVMALFPSDLRELQRTGLYRVRLNQGGLWQTVTIDDFLPCDAQAYDNDPRSVCSHANGPQLWVLLIEKAAAKLRGGYYHLRADFATHGLVDLTGFPTFKIRLRASLDESRLFDLLAEADRYGAIMCASTPGESNFTLSMRAESSITGLLPGHAYSLLAACAVGDHRLVRVRNPWGSFEWKGEWSNADTRWTQPGVAVTVAKHLGCKPSEVAKCADVSTFWMSIHDFAAHFVSVAICLKRSFDSKPWCEARARGHLMRQDSSEYYRFVLSHPSHVIVGIHQPDRRPGVGADDFTALGLTVVRRAEEGDGNDNGLYNGAMAPYILQAAAVPTKDRDVHCPSILDVTSSATVKWPQGEYLLCAYTPSLLPHTIEPYEDRPDDWPPVFDTGIMRPVLDEIFTRFGLDERLNSDEITTFLDVLGLRDDGDRRELCSFARDARRGLSKAELGIWFASHSPATWIAMLKRLGYGPAKRPGLPPVLVSARRVGVSVHADIDVQIEKIIGDIGQGEYMQQLPILQNGRKLPYGDLALYVLHTSSGVGCLVENCAGRPLYVKFDASKSQNCESNVGSLIRQMRLLPQETKIALHLWPKAQGSSPPSVANFFIILSMIIPGAHRWSFAYELDWDSA